MKDASYLMQLCGLDMIVCQFMIKVVIYKNDSKQMRSTCFAFDWQWLKLINVK